jgi:hypothetical protein
MKKLLFLSAVIAFATNPVHAQIAITSDTNTVQLVNDFILSGVSSSNVVYTGAPNTLGTFTNGNTTNIGLSNGIIMTTGSLSFPIGAAASVFANSNNNMTGCTELNTIIGSAMTYDASILEFDLVPVGNVLEFQYVFASEEYPEYVCSQFNDVFGFFINGPDPAGGNYTNTNIAIIPSTTLPVAINTINNGTNGNNGDPGGCISLAYSSLYIDNEAIGGSTIVYDGFTTVLLAQLYVTPLDTYHLKMAVADVSDGIYDSGIFLKSKSMKSYFSVTGIDEGKPGMNAISPNPSTDKVNINLNQQSLAGNTSIEIYNSSGQLLMQQPLIQEKTELDISGFAKGIYIVKLISDKNTETTRFVKE